MHPGVREARESDLDRILQLIVDLASYEKAAHEVKTTTEQLRQRALRTAACGVRARRAKATSVWSASPSTFETSQPGKESTGSISRTST